MIKKLKRTIFSLVSAAVLFTPMLLPAVASAQSDIIQNGACAGATGLQIGTGTDSAPTTNCSTVSDTGTSTINHLLTTAINIFSVIVGVIAVIMIVVGAFRYITSGGDSTKVGNAKNTILYALIGLVIVALAQVVVKFVLAKSIGASTAS